MALRDIVSRGLGTIDDLGTGTPFLTSISVSVRRNWITTLQALRAYEASTLRDDVVEAWEIFGGMHGFNGRRELLLLWLGRYNTSTPVRPHPGGPAWANCAWSGCMCFDQKPLYRLSACTGCWKVYYCGKKCQKRCVQVLTDSNCSTPTRVTDALPVTGEMAIASTANETLHEVFDDLGRRQRNGTDDT